MRYININRYLKAHKYLITDIVFVLVCFFSLLVFKGGLLFHMEQYSLFVWDLEQFSVFMDQPGGFLALVGTFLTQFCHFPSLGALFIAFFLWLLAFLIRTAFRLGESRWLISFIPSIFLLLFICRLDYSVFILKTYGMLFSQILGLISAVSIIFIYRKWFESGNHQIIFILSSVFVFFPIIGIYAMIPAVFVALDRKDKKVVSFLAAVIICICVPLLCSFLPDIYQRINRQYVFMAGIPYMEFQDNIICMIPLFLAILTILIIPFTKKVSLRFSVLSLTVAVVLLATFTNWDPNFRAVLSMERAISCNDWNAVLSLAKQHQEPTRVQVLYRNIALFQKGRLTEDMFKYPDGSASLRTRAHIPISYVCAAPVLHYCGMVNSCDRLVMETSASFSKNIYFYKYQARNAMLRGEYELARKYITIVSRNWFQGKWVRRHLGLLDNPDAMKTDGEFSLLLALMRHDAGKYDAVEPLESMLLRNFSNPEYVNEQIYEWQMATLLTWKDSQKPIFCFFNRANLFPGSHVTNGIAEAIALFASMTGDTGLMSNLVDILSSQKFILRKFGDFSNSMNMTRDPQSERAREQFKKPYGNTYWFYYFYNNISALL